MLMKQNVNNDITKDLPTACGKSEILQKKIPRPGKLLDFDLVTDSLNKIVGASGFI